MIDDTIVYMRYWEREKLNEQVIPRFPILKWYSTEGLSESERVIFQKIRDRKSVLDIGAGNLRIKEKFKNAGFSGEYHTQDIGNEFTYTYKNVKTIDRKYSAILCLDVIEHMELSEGLGLIHILVNILDPGGVIVIQTPNARCVRSSLYWDMTHVHCYNIYDLWAYLTCMGLNVEGYRIVFELKKMMPLKRFRVFIAKYVITHLLGMDYADNILLVATKNRYRLK